jgi:hypothetical protein
LISAICRFELSGTLAFRDAGAFPGRLVEKIKKCDKNIVKIKASGEALEERSIELQSDHLA